jgi:hypothetical protein
MTLLARITATHETYVRAVGRPTVWASGMTCPCGCTSTMPTHRPDIVLSPFVQRAQARLLPVKEYGR